VILDGKGWVTASYVGLALDNIQNVGLEGYDRLSEEASYEEAQDKACISEEVQDKRCVRGAVWDWDAVLSAS